ncbi:MAG: ATP synthase F1 subunit gamma [Patescibacteria group bacterium]
MPVSTRLIKRRIKSIQNTRKITKAMELVAASKMKRAIQLAMTSRAYAATARTLVDDIMHLADPATHAMLTGTRVQKEHARTLLVICSSDRGLCGGFNSQIIKYAIEFAKSRNEENVSIIAIGKQAARAAKRAGLKTIATFESISSAPSFLAARPIGTLAVDEFVSHHVDRVFIAYTNFHSAMSQDPMVEQILPIIPEDYLDATRSKNQQGMISQVVFEPNPKAVLNILLPKLVKTRIYQALLESAASEHSARMVAMQSATENATSMVDGLTLSFNQARQALITQEISEISAGKAAIE